MRCEKENDHISLVMMTIREGLEQVGVKGEGGLDLDLQGLFLTWLSNI